MSSPRPESFHTTVCWWPLEFKLRSNDRQVVEWFENHLYTDSDVGDLLHSSVHIDADVDLALPTEMSREVAATEGHEVETGNVWIAGTSSGRRAWAHPAHSPTEGTLVLVEVDPARWRLVGTSSHDVAVTAVRIRANSSELAWHFSGQPRFTQPVPSVGSAGHS